MSKSKNPVHYAEFMFRPPFDWSREEAKTLFSSRQKEYNAKLLNTCALDRTSFSDCIPGMKKLPAQSVDLVIADPPFGIEFNSNKRQNGYNRKSEYLVPDYHEIPTSDYLKFTETWVSEVQRVLKKTGSAVIFSGWTHLAKILQVFESLGFHCYNHVIWRYQFALFTRKRFASSHYHILFYSLSPKKRFFNLIEWYPQDVWNINREYAKGEVKNKTKLPDALIRKILGFCSRPGDLILDPFMGNGTTGKIALQEYRHYLGFEINAHLYSVIQKNTAVESGETYLPYRERIPSTEELAQKPGYKQAYLRYCSEQEGKGGS